MERKALQALWEQTLGLEPEWSKLSGYETYKIAPRDLLVAELQSGRAPYLELEELGRGGMGVVQRAYQSSLDRHVAIKKLREDIDGEPQSAASRNFLAEARLTGMLEHPNILPVHDLDVAEDGRLRMIMKLVGGRSWSEMLTEEGLDFHLEVLLQLCNAVSFAHSRGVAHNDLKPANVMLGSFGEVWLMDWGVAVEISEHRHASLRHKSSVHSPCGTPAYMPPELAEGRGEDIGAWTDIYLLGGILCELVRGHPPHSGDNFLHTIESASRGAMPQLGADVPAELRRICHRALAAEPRNRHGSVRELQAELRDYLRHRESLQICERADESLRLCQRELAGETDEAARTRLYEGFAQAVAGFSQARALWPGEAAVAGEQRARLAFARAALEQKDLGLAEAQLAQVEPSRESQRLGASVAALRARREAERLRTEELLEARGHELSELRASIAALRPEHLLSEADRCLAQTPIQTVERSHELDGLDWIAPTERQANLAIIEDLLRLAWRQRRLLELGRQPISGKLHSLLEEGEDARLQEASAAHMERAFRLALHTESYDVAEIILTQMELVPERRHEHGQTVEQARGARLVKRKRLVRLGLDQLRRKERPHHHASPAELVIRFSSFRHPEIVDLLEERLQPYLVQARAGLHERTEPEQREICVILQLLGHLVMPRRTVPVLGRFMAVVEHHELAVACGLALCSTLAQETRPILAAARQRLGADSATWQAIEPFLARLTP